MSVQHLILSKPQPLQRAKRYVPVYLFLVGFILSAMTVVKALLHFDITLHFYQKMVIALALAFLFLLLGTMVLNRMTLNEDMTPRLQFFYIEKMFAGLMALTACAMVFAHGSNDVAITMGPVAAVIAAVNATAVHHHSNLLYFILFLGCVGVVTGLLMYGRRVIVTVGSGITALTPTRAFSATLAAATAVVISTTIGIPVSATQTLVGAVLGVGLARGIGALDLGVIRNIFLSWIITLPIGAAFTVGFFYLLKQIF